MEEINLLFICGIKIVIGPFWWLMGESIMLFSMFFICLSLVQYLTICLANGEMIEISKLISQKGTTKLNEIKKRPMAKMEEESMPTGIDIGRLPFKMPNGIEPNNIRRCQFNNGTLWASATECEDDLESESCVNIFGKGEPRPPICLNSELFDLAKRCAKTCRLCCERPKFNCIDSGMNLMDCRAHQEKCNEPAWLKIMMVVCEHTCGFCSTEKCFDSAPDCPSLRSLCFERPISPLFRQQCPLTCGLCQPVERDEGKEEEEMNNQKAPKELIVLVRKKNGIKCEDLSTSCTENAKLCNDENYSQLLEEKCAKTCGHCQKEEEEEIAIKRIRHGKRKERQIMERPMATTNNKRLNMKRKNGKSPIIVIDNRKMVKKRAKRKEKMKMRQNGVEMVQIRREIQADQGEKIRQIISPIIVMVGGREEEEEEMKDGIHSEMKEITGNEIMMKMVETILAGKEQIILTRNRNESRRKKRNTNTKLEKDEKIVDELLKMETNGKKGMEENSQKEPGINEQEEVDKEEKDEEKEKQDDEDENEEEGEEEDEQADNDIEGILEILKEKLGNGREFKKDDEEEDEGINEDEEVEDDSIEEEKFNESEKRQSSLDNEQNLEKELAMAGIEPDIKKNEEMEMSMERGGRRKPKIIRVRIRPSEKRRKNKKNEELGKFDGILRNRQGKALKIEEMKGGIGGVLEEIREKYGIKNEIAAGNGYELLVEMGKEMKEELLAILRELRKIRRTNKMLANEQREMEKKERKKRKNEENEAEREEKIREENDDGKRMLNMLGKILRVAKNQQKKSTNIKEEDEEEFGSVDKLVEMLRKRLDKNGENEEKRKRKVKKQELALIDDGEGTNPTRLIQFVKMPGQKLATIPTKIIVRGSRLLNGPILENGEHIGQPKQPQIIISAPFQQQPQQPPPSAAAVLLPQPIPQPNNIFQSPSSQQQIVQQPQLQPIPQQQPIANNMNNNPPSAAVKSPQQSPLPQFQPRPPPQFVIQHPISSPREILLVQPARPRRPFSLLRSPSIGIGTRTQQNGIGGGAFCRDYYPYCEQIVPHGFCNSEFYPLRMKREFCPQSCNLC